ncbi:alkaline phosphatase family protein [Mycoplasma todarodis]|uniref:Metalloenzyme domain-containing protein n=1 Tax=Mycoplasma todarodis TaxID=1937191 RepID=A0A4R0XVB4_9MOLU|nr:alkaline phosphatase family protein [Mycoplasma todarodis]TCG11669.1 hypothetical protein C4B25_00980 [Mycoplasma todarodis]
MKFKLSKRLLLATTITLTPVVALTSVSCGSKSSEVDPSNHTRVVWVGIDGFSANVWKQHKTPNIKKLLTNSNYSMDAQDIMPSKTYPNWTALFTSMKPNKTGIESNPGSVFDSKLIKKPTKWNNDGKGVAYSIFDAIKEQTKLKSAFVYPLIKDFNITKIISKDVADLYFAEGDLNNKEEFIKVQAEAMQKKKSNPSMSFSSIAAYVASELTDKYSIEKAGDLLINQKSDFTFSYVTGLDIRGHAFGWGSKEYLEYMNKVDAYIGKLIDTIQNYNNFKNTIFVLTADHGGVINGKNHGNNTPDERTVPIIIHNGNQIKSKNLGIISNLDVAPTLAKSLKLKSNSEWEGKSQKLI